MCGIVGFVGKQSAAPILLKGLQQLAYYAAKEKGCDIDKPKNIAKSVTVE